MNRLADETSPYLRQHAENPVDWYPWGPDAFAAARLRDCPILLSVGYSACHWCHVMAHESFEDGGTAAKMNERFVCVKVDREERPDVDSIYMEAVQAVTGSGGWPMTVFLLPDGRPFHGGTYFPRPHFLELMDQIGTLWQTRRPELEEAAAKLAQAIQAGTALPGQSWAGQKGDGGSAPPDLLEATTAALLARFDPVWGGFGRTPKFPQPSMIETLLLAYHRIGRADVRDAVVTTLDAMAAGGIYDHLAGGFARYSTDRAWLVPHFEKMLYDNALLARIYLHAWQATGLDRYRQVVTETLEYLLSPPMRLPAAGLASAEDADSEGEEGRFYVWDHDEVLEVGGPSAVEWYGVTPGGNWEGHNILFRPQRGQLERSPEVEKSRQALLERRAGRVRPGLDDKVLTEWNAMAITALAEGGAALGQDHWVSAATEIAEFLLAELRDGSGRWLRSWQAGRARHLAYGSDYAWLVTAFLALAAATGQARWIKEATQAADALIDLFWDGSAFAAYGRDAEQLIARPVDTQDGALPSTNSVAAVALIRLSALTGADGYQDRARAIIDSMAGALGAAPVAFTGLVAAAELARTGLTEIVVTGDRPDLVQTVTNRYLPEVVLSWGEPFDSPLWSGRTGPDLAGLAFVCRDYTCRAPVGDAAALAQALSTASTQIVSSMDDSVD